jgi:hypothetical protein
VVRIGVAAGLHPHLNQLVRDRPVRHLRTDRRHGHWHIGDADRCPTHPAAAGRDHRASAGSGRCRARSLWPQRAYIDTLRDLSIPAMGTAEVHRAAAHRRPDPRVNLDPVRHRPGRSRCRRSRRNQPNSGDSTDRERDPPIETTNGGVCSSIPQLGQRDSADPRRAWHRKRDPVKRSRSGPGQSAAHIEAPTCAMTCAEAAIGRCRRSGLMASDSRAVTPRRRHAVASGTSILRFALPQRDAFEGQR